jgi:hypothetical protein
MFDTKWPCSTYVVSKISLAPYWREHRRRLRIQSSWIDDGTEDQINFREAWLRYLNEAASVTHCLVRADTGELKGGLFEIGAALGGGARVLIVGELPSQMRTLKHHPMIIQFHDYRLAEAFLCVDQKHSFSEDEDTRFLELNMPGWKKLLQ